ncbi:hypothetical protein ACLOJK_017713 [Asimina triloba]
MTLSLTISHSFPVELPLFASSSDLSDPLGPNTSPSPLALRDCGKGIPTTPLDWPRQGNEAFSLVLPAEQSRKAPVGIWFQNDGAMWSRKLLGATVTLVCILGDTDLSLENSSYRNGW